MFQFDWGSRKLWRKESAPKLNAEASRIPGSPQGAMVLQWQEHCVECALPLCYQVCPLYVQRKDKKCARLVYGIFRNPEFCGLLHGGADVRFRRWGKLEATLAGRTMSTSSIRLLDGADRVLTAAVNGLATLFSPVNPKRRLNGAWTVYRSRLLKRLGKDGTHFDGFAVECYSFQRETCQLIVEILKDDVPVYRRSLPLEYGFNSFFLPVPLPAKFGPEDHYRMMTYPDQDREIRVVFTWLDFVVLREAGVPAIEPAKAPGSARAEAKPASKVKCVAWDLDNTLWQGTLVEDGPQNVRIRPEAESLIRWLDERGIIQTVVSKNNHEEAMAVLAGSGLDRYFLYPAINWGQKSANLQQIAERLNLGIDTFALLDDSAFERREVASALPMVRVFPDTMFNELAKLPEFEVPITEASRMRRQSYLTEIQRERVQESFGSNYVEFLRSCGLTLKLFSPSTEQEIARCLELIQRSNQLNLSSRRFSEDEFRTLLARPDMLNLAMACEDKFGDYGIVGFASIELGGADPVARDFVLSCRVAQKHVEHALYSWLGVRMRAMGAKRLLVKLIRTRKNGPLVKVFEELPFVAIESDGDTDLLCLDLNRAFVGDDVVGVDDSALDAVRA